MSYQVLARKWRPRTFREMVGQEHVLQALINALDHDRLHHAYLFTGTRGVGKTTIARILAKCLNCEIGVSSEPCGQCASCVEIAEGRFVDLIEVDAASRTKVEDTRELLENVQYAPTRGRYKVYLIDEVHMLSAHSFNALLKTLEEPPPHVKFLLATTDPQKLPVTILSRCLQFNLKNMNPERIVQHLQFVLEKELVPFEEPALWHLGRAADGSMRDAMSLTDQAIAFGNGKVAELDVRSMLGTIDKVFVYDMIKGLAAQDGQAVLEAVARLAEHAPDYSGALAELLSILHRVAIAQALPAAIDNSFGDRDDVLAFAQQIPSEDLQLFYQTALLARRDLPLAPDPRGGFEMALLRMLAFKPQGVLDVPKSAAKREQAAAPAVEAPEPSQPVAEKVPVSAEESAEVKKPEARTEAVEPPPWASEPVQEATDSSQGAEQTQTTGLVPEREQERVPETLETQASGSARELETIQEQVLVQEPERLQGQATTQEPELVPESPPVSEPELAPAPPQDQFVQTTPEQTPEPKPVSAPAPMPDAAIREPIQKANVPAKFEVQTIALEDASSENWVHIYLGLGCGGVLQSTVSNCVLSERQGNDFSFILDEANSTLYDPSHQERLAGLLERYFEQPVNVVIFMGQVSHETPAGTLIRLKTERQAEALRSMQSDSIVQQMIETFAAVLQEDSVAPID